MTDVLKEGKFRVPRRLSRSWWLSAWSWAVVANEAQPGKAQQPQLSSNKWLVINAHAAENQFFKKNHVLVVLIVNPNVTSTTSWARSASQTLLYIRKYQLRISFNNIVLTVRIHEATMIYFHRQKIHRKVGRNPKDMWFLVSMKRHYTTHPPTHVHTSLILSTRAPAIKSWKLPSSQV